MPKHKGWMQDATNSKQRPDAADGGVVLPLEFKTGKPHISHRAQVISNNKDAATSAIAEATRVINLVTNCFGQPSMMLGFSF